MKNLISFLVVFSLAFSLVPQKSADLSTDSPPEDNSGAVVCPPDIYLQAPDDCLPLGPSEYLTEMARMGLTLPLQPLPATPTDPALRSLPYHYYKVDPATGTRFFLNQDAAQEKKGAVRVIAPGKLLYVIYEEAVDTGKGIYFRLPSNYWMPGDGSRISLLEYQPGLEFRGTPRNSFGWILEPNTPVRSQPTLLASNLPIRTLNLYDVVQVYSVQNIEGFEWALIGPDEWVEGRKLAVVTPASAAPDGVDNNRWIDVDLSEQTLAVYDKGQMVFATVMASGADPTWTRPGLFKIYQKKETETMAGDSGTPDYYYLEGVPWTMYFDKARALHGAYWRARMGYAQSHGCINMTVGDAHWLFNWAHEEDWVYVHDPSGLTPTDPALYGDGSGS